MKSLYRSNRSRRLWIALTAVLILLAAIAPTFAAEQHLTAEEIQTYGERMYREGILPSGEPMKAYVSDDVPVDGTAFTCVSCHLRSGMGSVESETITPPTNGQTLYRERKAYVEGAAFVPLIHNYSVYLPERPAYTDESLATLIATGIDPVGRSVLHIMPRYDIEDRDMEIMIAYLKTLSSETSPGVKEKLIHFATVIVEGSDPVKVKSMLTPFQFSVDRKNSLAVASKNNDRVARMGYNMLGDLAFFKFTLSQWILKGEPDTWRAQLENYYSNEPVFALLGGISPGTWEPVHKFCEDYQLPNLYPVVDYPVISDSDWYTLYLSRGFRQEGEAAARYLGTMAELFGDQPVVQIFRDTPRGRALAEGFNSTWKERHPVAAVEIVLGEDEKFYGLQMQQVIAKHRPAALLYWDDAKLLPNLSALVGVRSAPDIIIASGTWLGDDLWSTPSEVRKFLYLTYPYRLPQQDKFFDTITQKVLAGKPYKDFDSVTLRKAFIGQEILGKALNDMRGEYYRDFLIDTISMFDDSYPPLYERISFGQGQNYASKGCFIVQLGEGDQPQLERRSEWVVR